MRRYLLSLVLVPFWLWPAMAAPAPYKPYRALVVVERWRDPASVLVSREDTFQPVAALLKAWSIPFEIFRLDQQHLDGTYLFDREDRIRYGVVIWLSDSPSYEGQNLAALRAAADAGTSLIAINSRCLDPALNHVLGLEFKSVYRADEALRTVQPVHFITRELAAKEIDPRELNEGSDDRFWMGTPKAAVLISQGLHPVLTVNQLDKNVSGVWMGTRRISGLLGSPYWRGLFFRALVWSLGYVIQPNIDYSHRIEIEMDDWGTSDKGYLSYWQYVEPSEQTLREHLIAVLQKHHAVASANVNTGYVDRRTGRILDPWKQAFTDSYGRQQDYASTQRGLKDAVAAGVLEIQSHGWTHMQPDLESPPGPWWTADLKGEASAGAWYTEFSDGRRDIEVPAIVQLFHLQRSLEYLRKDFGQRPLEFRPGGAGWSKSLANETGIVAARVGLGLFHAEPESFYYLDRDLVIDMAGISPQKTVAFDEPFATQLWPPHPDGPFMALFHDRDIAYQPEFVERLFTALPAGYQTISTNQYVGFLHTRIESSNEDGWQLKFLFDEQYCPYFTAHSSGWRVWMSDPWRDELKSLPEPVMTLDGKPVAGANISDLSRGYLTFDVPAGLGEHVWKLGRGE